MNASSRNGRFFTLHHSRGKWCPHLLKDIQSLEQVQRQITKCIIPDQTLDYKSRLANLDILPLMYFYELQDLLFFTSLLDPDDTINIHTFVSFSGPSRCSHVHVHVCTACSVNMCYRTALERNREQCSVNRI